MTEEILFDTQNTNVASILALGVSGTRLRQQSVSPGEVTVHHGRSGCDEHQTFQGHVKHAGFETSHDELGHVMLSGLQLLYTVTDRLRTDVVDVNIASQVDQRYAVLSLVDITLVDLLLELAAQERRDHDVRTQRTAQGVFGFLGGEINTALQLQVVGLHLRGQVHRTDGTALQGS